MVVVCGQAQWPHHERSSKFDTLQSPILWLEEPAVQICELPAHTHQNYAKKIVLAVLWASLLSIVGGISKCYVLFRNTVWEKVFEAAVVAQR